MLINKYILGLVLLLLVNLAFAQSPPLTIAKTKGQIRELENKIASLQNNLSQAKNKNTLIQQELAETDKQIHLGMQKLTTCQQDIATVEKDIQIKQVELDQFIKDLKIQQAHLAKHVTLRYQIGKAQPLKWILNQQDPYKASRLLTYYQYIIQSRQDLIATMENTRKKMDESNQKLTQALAANKQLHAEQLTQQEKLEKEKIYRVALIQSLQNTIKNQQNSIDEAVRNKQDLEKLLQSLAENTIPQPSRPFQLMRKKLPFPLHMSKRTFQKMNQGVTFFADEGVPVTSVYPGKVVFSDWLKGYGLLLIIDHGHGFMTLYAYNQALFAHKGQMVKQGSTIASVGHTGGLPRNGLYFEVRHKGKAVSPLEWFS